MKYTFRPIDIEAWEFTGEATEEQLALFQEKENIYPIRDSIVKDKLSLCARITDEKMLQSIPVGNYIIKLTAGVLYTCTSKLFVSLFLPLDSSGEISDWCEGGCHVPAAGSDSEGVPLCQGCLDMLKADSADKQL